MRIAIFDDNIKIRQSLEILLNGSAGLEVCGSFDNANDAEVKVKQSNPDLILMDIEMPGISGVEAVKIIKSKFPDVCVIMQTVFDDDEKIFQSILNGASGYVLKNAEPVFLLTAINDASRGGAPMSPSIAKKVLMLMQKKFETKKPVNDFQLTTREKEILQHLVNGLSYKMIAESCSISYQTVCTHIKNIYEKLHVDSNTEAVIKAMREGLVE